jgi:hypothetical protein
MSHSLILFQCTVIVVSNGFVLPLKVFCDNYLDGGYHVPYAHKGLASGLKLESYSYTVCPILLLFIQFLIPYLVSLYLSLVTP